MECWCCTRGLVCYATVPALLTGISATWVSQLGSLCASCRCLELGWTGDHAEFCGGESSRSPRGRSLVCLGFKDSHSDLTLCASPAAQVFLRS